MDIGFGDAVTPAAQEIVYPTLLDDLPSPRMRVYPRETVFAEKLEAIVSLGMANSRMKDYFDLLALARENAMNAAQLGAAVGARNGWLSCARAGCRRRPWRRWLRSCPGFRTRP